MEKLSKRNQVQTKKIQNILGSVTVEFPQSLNLANLAKIVKKTEDKKDSFVYMIEKMNIPSGKHIVDEIEDF